MTAEISSIRINTDQNYIGNNQKLLSTDIMSDILEKV